MRATFPILLVGSARPMSMEHMYRRALLANGQDHVDLLDVEVSRPAWMRNRVVNRIVPAASRAWAAGLLRTRLLEAGDRYRWIIVFKGMEFSRRTLEECRRLAPSALWININPDDPYNVAARGASNANVVESIPFFDAYCMWSRSIIEKLRADGCKRPIYLPFGYDESCQLPHAAPMRAEPPFTLFFGTWDPEREAVLAQLEGYNVMIHGSRWERAAPDFPLKNGVVRNWAFGPAIAPIVAASAICLNHLRWQNRDSHNLRTFEIPALGGLLLTNRTDEQHAFFPENEACYMYADIAELKAKIDYILANRQEAECVRARGIEMVKEHTLKDRARRLMEELAR